MTKLKPKISLPKMTAVQFRAIERFAETNGKSWKSNLRQAWMQGNYRMFGADHISSALQQLRNSATFGPNGLVNFRLSDEERSTAIWRRLVIQEMTSEERQQIEATRILMDTTNDEIEFNSDDEAEVYIKPAVLNDDLGNYIEFQVGDGRPGIRTQTLDFLSLREALEAYESIRKIGWKAHYAKEYPKPPVSTM